MLANYPSFPYAEDENQAYAQQMSSTWKFYLPEDSRPHGLMIDSVVKRMPWTADFSVASKERQIRLLRPEGDNWQKKCTQILDYQVQLAREKGAFPKLGKHRGEQFPIVGAKFPVGIDRSAFSLFGLVGRGVHMTAYTQQGHEYRFWVPQRNLEKSTYPGMLDNTVAGGMAIGEEPFECLIREASEEAGMSEEQIRRDTLAVGTVTWMNISDERAGGESGLINPGVLFVYDLQVSESATFKPVDGDVQAFHLMNTHDAKVAMLDGKFKPASANVLLDFMVRHGLITAEEEPAYTEIVSRLHRKLPLSTISLSPQ
ncbi:NUDIX hydrolase domain-like protein [Penicillium odoratum]|uniref:NUDIX hydrolase domain-like protein n=1 Tax=Penicillium odoratum TaxID=1167516 RepID=UPI002547D419|nr:NUDIX hydrolase domain-like protein [Penicillium odoratum]KAJ5777244.1 NUDIX hydrolase domain-like protein [Penicillium odoratum]